MTSLLPSGRTIVSAPSSRYAYDERSPLAHASSGIAEAAPGKRGGRQPTRRTASSSRCTAAASHGSAARFAQAALAEQGDQLVGRAAPWRRLLRRSRRALLAAHGRPAIIEVDRRSGR